MSTYGTIGKFNLKYYYLTSLCHLYCLAKSLTPHMVDQYIH